MASFRIWPSSLIERDERAFGMTYVLISLPCDFLEGSHPWFFPLACRERKGKYTGCI